MGQVLPLPYRGEVFVDLRGEGRTLRISGHPAAATVVLSIWEHNQCRATFRLAANQVDDLVRAILAAAPPAAPQPGMMHPLTPSRGVDGTAGSVGRPPPGSSPHTDPVDDLVSTETETADRPVTTHLAEHGTVTDPDDAAGSGGAHPSPPAVPRDQAG